MLPPIALALPAKVTIAVLFGVLLFGLVSWAVEAGRRHGRREVSRIVEKARASDRTVRAGLRSMAELYDYLIEHPTALSERGVSFLDAHAEVADSFIRTLQRAREMSRDRRIRHLMRELRKLFGHEETFRRFRDQVLHEAVIQMRARTVAPPIRTAGRGRVSFTILRHDLPAKFWPLMQAALATEVRLRMRDVDRTWHRVKLQFAAGGKAEFHPRHLARAVALELSIGRPGRDQVVFEFEVEHQIPIRRADGTMHPPSVEPSEP